MNTEERLDRLEQQNRNLRRGLIGLLLLVLVVPLAAFVWQDKKLKVAKFDTIEANEVRAKWLYATDLKMVKGKANIHLAVTDYGAIGSFQYWNKHVAVNALSDAFVKETEKKRMGTDSASIQIHGDGDYINLDINEYGPSVGLSTTGKPSVHLGPIKKRSESHFRQSYLRFYDMKSSPFESKIIHQVPK